jgi:hypothetical protein
MTHTFHVPTVLPLELGGGWAPQPLRMQWNRVVSRCWELDTDSRRSLSWQSHYLNWAVSVAVGIVHIFVSIWLIDSFSTQVTNLHFLNIVQNFGVLFIFILFYFIPPPCHHMSHMDFMDSPPGCGWNVTDFWIWDAHEAQLRCSDEVDGDIWIWSTRRGLLKPKFYCTTQTMVTKGIVLFKEKPPWQYRESNEGPQYQ